MTTPTTINDTDVYGDINNHNHNQAESNSSRLQISHFIKSENRINRMTISQQQQPSAMQHFLQQANNHPTSSMWDTATTVNGNAGEHPQQSRYQPQYEPHYQHQYQYQYQYHYEPSSKPNSNLHNALLNHGPPPPSQPAQPQQSKQVPDVDMAQQPFKPQPTKTSTNHNSSAPKSATTQSSAQQIGRELFPDILYRLLMDSEKEGNTNIVAWTASGMAFKVHRREEFMEKVLPRYLRQSRYKSFVRQLNLWGLACVNQGPDRGAYFNSKFQRGRPDLVNQIPRIKCRRTHVRRPNSAPDDLMAEIDGHHIHLVGNQNIDDIMTPSMGQRSQSSDSPSLSEFEECLAEEPNESSPDACASRNHAKFDNGQENHIEDGAQDWVDTLEEFFALDGE